MFSSQSDLTECLERQSEHRRVINSCTEINYCSVAALQAGLIGLLSSSNDHSDSHNNPNCPAIQEQAEILFSGDTERHRETQRDTEGHGGTSLYWFLFLSEVCNGPAPADWLHTAERDRETPADYSGTDQQTHNLPGLWGTAGLQTSSFSWINRESWRYIKTYQDL